MIIKELTRTGKSANASSSKALIEYILRYNARSTKRSRTFTQKQQASVKMLLTHNIRGEDIDSIIKAFVENAKHRVDQRKNMALARHIIMSFSPKSTPYLTEKTLKSLGREFIALRGKDNLYCMTVHYEKHHVHAHIAISSASVDGLRSSRIGKKEFANLKERLSEFQHTRYPELSDSLPKHGRAKHAQARDERSTEQWAMHLPSQKKALRKAIEAEHAKSKSMDEFLQSLKALRIEPYYRGGKLAGISMDGDRKFRFKSLGFEDEIQQLIEKEQKEHEALASFAKIRARANEKDRGKDDERCKGFGDSPNANRHGDLQSLPHLVMEIKSR